MRHLWTSAGGLLAGLLLAGPAAAQISYQFADASGIPVGSGGFSLAVGDTLRVRLYLLDSSLNATAFNSNGGLGTAAVKLRYDIPATGRTAVTTTNNISPNVAAGQFDGAFPSAAADSAAVLLYSPTSRGVLPDADGRVLLATFTLTGQSAGSVNLRAVDYSPAQYDTSSFATDPITFAPLVNYDPLISPAQAPLIVFVPVPEPTAALLAAAAGVAFWGRVVGRSGVRPPRRPGRECGST